MLHVVVNATSANVCVGFDVLGLSLALTNDFTFEIKDEFSFKGFEAEFSKKETNLVYYSYVKYFEYINMEPIKVEIGFKGNIPVSRGLGSSSSLIVAGVFAANELAGNKLSKDELFNICVEIEGHPDNVAPAVYGGLVASYKHNDSYKAIKYPVSDNLKFTVIIPDFKLSTEEARGVLPKALEYKDIVHNTSRIVHIPMAFSNGDLELLCELFDDKLHEPYRGKLIPGYEEIKKLCNENNIPFCISGSGSTMLVISRDNVDNLLAAVKYEKKSLEVGQGVKIWRD